MQHRRTHRQGFAQLRLRRDEEKRDGRSDSELWYAGRSAVAEAPHVSRIYDVARLGAATHALIIGVGDYPDIGVTGLGLGPLVSPISSALELADWMTNNLPSSDRPLASLRLLVSRGNAPVPLPGVTPTIAAIQRAVGEWITEGNTNPDHLMLFYFCGHGLGANTLLALLADDFGENVHDPLDGAIDFKRFHSGMNACAAKHQCFFIDACRNDVDLVAYGEGAAGRRLVSAQVGTPKKQQPTFYSTQRGQLAFGPTGGRASYFAQALIAALEGMGGERQAGAWSVGTIRLYEGLAAHMRRTRQTQLPPADELTQFRIRPLLIAPKVPVYVSCAPAVASQDVHLRCSGQGIPSQDQPARPSAACSIRSLVEARMKPRVSPRAVRRVMVPWSAPMAPYSAKPRTARWWWGARSRSRPRRTRSATTRARGAS